MAAAGIPNQALVVDDEPFELRTTAHVLGSMGFDNVLTAESGQQALQLMERAGPPLGLLMLDLNMPGMDGIELIRRLGDEGYPGDILLFSAEDPNTLNMAESLARARNLSVIGSIAKPVQREALVDLIANGRSYRGLPPKWSDTTPVTPQMLQAGMEAGELVPWFQPKIDIASRQPVGVEILARWPHSSQGPIYPDAFIPVAEASGLIDPLTFYLLERSIRIRRSWQSQGLDLKLAVNISMDSLHSLDFPQRLDETLTKAGSSLESIQLEVTESRLMQDQVVPLDVLLRLRLRKVHLSIDDFGTGHSNLSQLRDLPFDELKLDRSFVRGKGERSAAILESSVEMAKKLGMSIVAEGVETLEDWQRVEQLGCHQIQGWFCAMPMAGEAIPDWVTSWPESRKRLFA